MASHLPREGLGIARLLMVLSSISPLFILWAIQGNTPADDEYFIPFCAVMVILPNAFLAWRIRTAVSNKEKREIAVGSAEDHRDHLLVYLFAMLMPFYALDLGAWRHFSAALVAIGFIVFLFWHLNLHYMNLAFAVLGYRVFTVHPPKDDNPLTGKHDQMLITRRASIQPGDRIMAYRLSNTVYFEGQT
jgi:hypothetical protein